ncbi:hypothetical protein [Mesorhizobium sp. CAU 1732]|uniref:hypothetical protein n=1 Tax=Mesorhizobium sp. CAU 1732 TaxID=3140358 RepID=UPI00326030E4
MRNWKSKLAGAVAALVIGSVGANAEGIKIIDQSEYTGQEATDVIGALMQPINPFITGAAQTTTSITQIGENNFATSSVEGTSSLSLIEQSGTRNRAVQAIEGHNSALLLVQGGTNNNVLQASRGDNNFQLVGVSGQNNNVGFVQVGDNLAGVLDVRGSTNSTVIAVQTPQSGNYMMPTGLRGLQNTAVVIVPGRMYVIPVNR